MRAILQHVSPTEKILSTYEVVNKYLPKLLMVVDWIKRSAFHRGATTAFAMALSHYPEGFEVDLVSEGYCSGSEVISIERVQELISMATPYAKGVLAARKLLPHLASQLALERPAPEPRDFPAVYPFRAALDGVLTTFVVNEWQVVEEPLATAKASTSAREQEFIDGGGAVQTETVAEDVNAGLA
jgi:hypothetical protein